MKLYVEADVQPEVLSGEVIAVLGYGSQGRAHAMNLTMKLACMGSR